MVAVEADGGVRPLSTDCVPAEDGSTTDEALEIAARHGCHPLRGVATYEDVY